MGTWNTELAGELVALAELDRATRDELARDGTLFEGYPPKLDEVNRRNAAALGRILARHGWPGRNLVGAEAAEAAWLVLQHAVGEPELLRRGLELVRQAVSRGEAEAWHLAMLEDRVRTLEGRSQLYGTQYDWDERGELSPLPIQEPAGVDARRAAMGLGPMEENTWRIRTRASAQGETAPRDPALRRRRYEEWARAVGWRSAPGRAPSP